MDERILVEARPDNTVKGKLTSPSLTVAHRWDWSKPHLAYVVDATHVTLVYASYVCLFRLARDVDMDDVVACYDPTVVRYGQLTLVNGKPFALEAANRTIKIGDRVVPIRAETDVVVRRFYNSFDVFYTGADGARRSLRFDFRDSPSSFAARHVMLAFGAKEGF